MARLRVEGPRAERGFPWPDAIDSAACWPWAPWPLPVEMSRAMPAPSPDPPFPHLDDLRRAYDGDASRRNGMAELEWRTGVLETWLQTLPRAPRLLELGPGTGQLGCYAERLGARVVAVDLSAQNVAYCRQRGLSASVGDFRALRHIDGLGRFDGVYAINALLHVPRNEHASVVAGARHCLVPGGHLLLVNWGGLHREGIWAEDSCDPPRFFSQYDAASFAALNFEGFEVVRREVLAVQAPDGQQPQLLALRSVPVPEAELP
jgi:SAM-dependent methyltransferase